jgi:hypothetical protein
MRGPIGPVSLKGMPRPVELYQAFRGSPGMIPAENG